MLLAKSPPATAANAIVLTIALLHSRRQSIQARTGGKSSALVIFENVTIPSSTDVAMSLAPPNSHRIPHGACSRVATCLYSKQKYARNPTAKLKSSGAIQTKYTGTTDASRKPAVRIAAVAARIRARRKT